MSPLNQTLIFIVKSLGSLLVFVVLLRFLLQLVRADFYNPVSQAIIRFTGPVLHPLRRLIPGFKGVDVASLVLALVIQIVLIYLLTLLSGHPFSLPFAYVLIIAVYELVMLLLNIYFYGLIIIAIASWVAAGSRNPLLVILHQLTHPVLSVVRRFVPPVGGLDFSLMVVIFVIVLIKNVLAHLLGGLLW